MSELKKAAVFLSLCAAAVFLPLLLGVTVIPADFGLGICFLCFFGIAPAVSVTAGFWAGRDPKHRWFGIFVPAAVFLISVWALLDFGEPQFLWYAGIYLALACAALLLAWLCGRLRQKIRERRCGK